MSVPVLIYVSTFTPVYYFPRSALGDFAVLSILFKCFHKPLTQHLGCACYLFHFLLNRKEGCAVWSSREIRRFSSILHQ